jgi:hypothetical protein
MIDGGGGLFILRKLCIDYLLVRVESHWQGCSELLRTVQGIRTAMDVDDSRVCYLVVKSEENCG